MSSPSISLAAPGPSEVLRRSARVLVTHPERQHAYETVLAAQEAGMLHQFATGFYLRADPAAPSLPWTLLPRRLRSRALAAAGKRRHPAIDPARVAIVPWFHGPARLLSALRLVPPGVHPGHLTHTADVLFDRAVARRLALQPRPTIVHAFENAALHTLKAARRIGISTLLDVPSAHEQFVAVNRQEGEPIDEVWQARETAYVRAARRFADWLLVASQDAARCLEENGVSKDRILFVPYGADPVRFRPADSHDLSARMAAPFRVLYVASMTPRRGIRYLLEAWRLLRLADAELTLVGGASPASRQLLSDLPANCRVFGNLPHAQIHRLFQSSDLFVCPSLAETGPLVVYEAMASGLPIVTTERARAVVREGIDGFIVPIRDPAAIAERIQWFYDHPSERVTFGKHARQRILDGYTWQHYRARLRAVYEAITLGHDPQTALSTLESTWPTSERAQSRVGS